MVDASAVTSKAPLGASGHVLDCRLATGRFATHASRQNTGLPRSDDRTSSGRRDDTPRSDGQLLDGKRFAVRRIDDLSPFLAEFSPATVDLFDIVNTNRLVFDPRESQKIHRYIADESISVVKQD